MNNDTFLETLHNTYEEQDSQPMVDPLVNLGFTPGFDDSELRLNTNQN